MAENPEDLIVTDAELRRQLPALAKELKIGGVAGSVPIFPTLAEAQAWEAANPGKKALTLEPSTPDTTAPIAGTLTVSVKDKTATGTVSGATDDRAVTGYAFRVGSGAWSAWQSSPTYEFTGLSASTPYWFQHQVRDAAGNVAVGTAVQATTLAVMPVTDDYAYQWLGSQAGGSTWTDTKAGLALPLVGAAPIVEGPWVQFPRPGSAATSMYGPFTLSSLTTSTPTMVVVMRARVDYANRMGVAVGTFGSGGSLGIMNRDGAAKIPGLLVNGAQKNLGQAAYADGVVGVAVARFASGSNSLAWNGGTPVVDGATFDAAAMKSTNMHLAYVGGNTAFAGDLAEVRIYNRRLTDAEATQVATELKQKYGIA
ncbi:hypothetical protein HMPREF0569_0506 [Micrococcus luteus SK58]|uniref:hypothetical protein n=1 Tax=Micrococcus luteus TaxID=1270 RepID=UPI0001C4FDB9|nr:hypothetical protein [Micrococcus luteus]EFD50464.1 hypothetical protein HMPREF0569_1146 [Micrococcus luteus SK58]EFD50780.1 hypothetical protein HMPREF0569_0506 [Micrococcus luteus SK58]